MSWLILLLAMPQLPYLGCRRRAAIVGSGILHGTYQSTATCLMDDINALAPCFAVCLISPCVAVPGRALDYRQSTTCIAVSHSPLWSTGSSSWCLCLTITLWYFDKWMLKSTELIYTDWFHVLTVRGNSTDGRQQLEMSFFVHCGGALRQRF